MMIKPKWCVMFHGPNEVFYADENSDLDF